MSQKERKQYNLVIFALFAAFFALFGGLSILLHISGDGPFSDLHPFLGAFLSFILFGLFAGWGFTSLVGGIWLGSRFVSKQGKGFIILVCVLFMFTIQIFWVVGMVVALPTAIRNVIWLKRNKGAEDFTQEPIATKRVKIRVAHVVSFVAIFAILIVTFSYFSYSSRNHFFPTIEEAFAHTAERGESGEFGEIFYIDEQENTITVFSLYDDQIIVTHYLTEWRYGERWYNNRPVFGHVMLDFHASASFMVYHAINEEGFMGRNNRRVREIFGRRPLFGTYRHDIIRNLSINGTPVDHVFEHTNERSERIFFWYISDIPPFTGSREDIVILFEP